MAPLSDTEGIFGASVYLRLPRILPRHRHRQPKEEEEEEEEQPAMEVWPLDLRSKWDFYRNAPTLSQLSAQDPEGQVILRRVLGEDRKETVFARPGDLVVVCVQRPHCAIGFGAGGEEEEAKRLRISLQCFLRHSGPHERLTVES